MSDFRPDQNLVLQALRAAWPDRDAQDRPTDPDWMVIPLEDGGVSIRPITSLPEIIDWIESRAEGDVG